MFQNVKVLKRGVRRADGNRRTCLFDGRIATISAERKLANRMIIPLALCEVCAAERGLVDEGA